MVLLTADIGHFRATGSPFAQACEHTRRLGTQSISSIRPSAGSHRPRTRKSHLARHLVTSREVIAMHAIEYARDSELHSLLPELYLGNAALFQSRGRHACGCTGHSAGRRGIGDGSDRGDPLRSNHGGIRGARHAPLHPVIHFLLVGNQSQLAAATHSCLQRRCAPAHHGARSVSAGAPSSLFVCTSSHGWQVWSRPGNHGYS